jgi:hypothetical protein
MMGPADLFGATIACFCRPPAAGRSLARHDRHPISLADQVFIQSPKHFRLAIVGIRYRAPKIDL